MKESADQYANIIITEYQVKHGSISTSFLHSKNILIKAKKIVALQYCTFPAEQNYKHWYLWNFEYLKKGTKCHQKLQLLADIWVQYVLRSFYWIEPEHISIVWSLI